MDELDKEIQDFIKDKLNRKVERLNGIISSMVEFACVEIVDYACEWCQKEGKCNTEEHCEFEIKEAK